MHAYTLYREHNYTFVKAEHLKDNRYCSIAPKTVQGSKYNVAKLLSRYYSQVKKTHLIKCCLASRRARRTKVFLLIKDSLSAAVFLRPAGREIIKLAASMGFQGFLLRPVETLRR